MARGLAGKRIKKVRQMTAKEKESQYWHKDDKILTIELDDGTLIFASVDFEGNGPGALFAHDKRGDFYVTSEGR